MHRGQWRVVLTTAGCSYSSLSNRSTSPLARSAQIGKIASQVSSSAPMTSLQREINRFVLIIASFAFVFGVVVSRSGTCVCVHACVRAGVRV